MARIPILLLLLLGSSSLPLLAQVPNGSITNPYPMPEENGQFQSPAPFSGIWYTYTSDFNGYAALTHASGRLIGFQAYTGEPGNLQLVTSDEYILNSYNWIEFPVKAGARYLIKFQDAGVGSGTTQPFYYHWEFQRGGLITYDKRASSFGGVAPFFHEVEGPVGYTLIRHGTPETRVTVNYSIMHDSAGPTDVSFVSPGTLVFEPGEKFKSIPLYIYEDAQVEGPETFRVLIESVEGALLPFPWSSSSYATVTIADDDDDPPNDSPEGAIEITGTYGSVDGTYRGADPDFLGYDVFYKWTAPVSGQFLIKGTPAVFENVLEEGGDILLPVAQPSPWKGYFNAVAGRSYIIVPHHFQSGAGSAGDFKLIYDMDQDGDLLVDSAEALAGTNPADMDSDDDGVIDSAELRPNEDIDGDGLVNVLDWDSDGDGLADGIEMGISIASAGTDLSAGHFIPDGDAGATTTDPMVADSDEGGASDGYEDKNRNGMVDAGEPDPNDWTDDPAGTIRFQVVDSAAEEGDTVSVVVERIGNFKGIATVSYATASLSGLGAASADDFTAVSGTITFAGNVRDPHTIEVPLVEDSAFEDAERFGITLSVPTNAVLEAGADAMVTILNDDAYKGSRESYAGIFSAAEGPAGAFELSLTSSRAFTGTLLHEHKRYRFRGTIGEDGTASVTIKRKGDLPLLMDLQMTGGNATVQARLREGVNDEGIELEADRASFGKTQSALPPGIKSQKLTVLLPPASGVPGQYAGTGYAVGTLTSKGSLRLAGVLPDGVKFSVGAHLDANREAVLQESLYNKHGGLYGPLTFDAEGTAATGELTWVRTLNPEIPSDAFSATIEAQGSSYSQPGRGDRILTSLDDTQGSFPLRFTESGVETPREAVAILGTNHRLTDATLPAIGLKGSANPRTGVVSGTIRPTDGAKVRFSGVFVQETGRFEGLFLRSGSTGRVRSVPLPQVE